MFYMSWTCGHSSISAHVSLGSKLCRSCSAPEKDIGDRICYVVRDYGRRVWSGNVWLLCDTCIGIHTGNQHRILRQMRHACLPVITRSVVRPPCFPKRMSVFNRSPTMIVREGSNPCLYECTIAKRNKSTNVWHPAYFAFMQSSMTFSGFPTTTGSAPRPADFLVPRFVPESDSFNGAQMEPAPGRIWIPRGYTP